MHSLVMSPSSHDFIKMDIDKLKYQQCFNSQSAWFLDGRTSILVMNGNLSKCYKTFKLAI